jgi:hypothetical protein
VKPLIVSRTFADALVAVWTRGHVYVDGCRRLGRRETRVAGEQQEQRVALFATGAGAVTAAAGFFFIDECRGLARSEWAGGLEVHASGTAATSDTAAATGTAIEVGERPACTLGACTGPCESHGEGATGWACTGCEVERGLVYRIYRGRSGLIFSRGSGCE